MPGRTPAEAVQAYLEPLQQSLSCFSKEILRTSKGSAPAVQQIATFASPTINLLTSSGEVLALSFIQSLAVEEQAANDWKVRTIAYYYGIEDEQNNEIVSFHWHPESDKSPIPYPHLHIGYGAGQQLRPEVAAIHFRTDRMAFEDLCILLVEEFGVVPDRSDALSVLTRNLDKFRKHRSWSSVPS